MGFTDVNRHVLHPMCTCSHRIFPSVSLIAWHSSFCAPSVSYLPSTRWRSISSLKCLSCRVLSPNWRRRRTGRCRNSGKGRNIDLWWFISSPWVFYFPNSGNVIFQLFSKMSSDLCTCLCRYTYMRCIIEKQLRCLPEGASCMWLARQNPPPSCYKECDQESAVKKQWLPPPRIPASARSVSGIIQSVYLQSPLTLARSCCMLSDSFSLESLDSSRSLSSSPLIIFTFHCQTWSEEKDTLNERTMTRRVCTSWHSKSIKSTNILK